VKIKEKDEKMGKGRKKTGRHGKKVKKGKEFLKKRKY
tara:strand:- start:1215 stop:1325 length:111 start_codon:yes stop_codon:yes gene_type:complete